MKTFQQTIHRAPSSHWLATKPAGSEAGRAARREVLGYPLQAKLKVARPGDALEREADAAADRALARPAPTAPVSSGPAGTGTAAGRHAPVQIQRHAGPASGRQAEAPASVGRALAEPGRALEPALRRDMEQRFGHDFSRVRLHDGGTAGQSAREVDARAYTVGQDIVFGAGEYAPGSAAGRHLLAHELAHTVQQSASPAAAGLQRTIGDGHDLRAPRFAGDPVLEACFDDERYLQFGNQGGAVEKLQRALVDAGFPLPVYGVDGIFGAETQGAVRDYQRARGLDPDGIVGPLTMGALDSQFATGAAPPGGTPPHTTPPRTTPPAPAATATIGTVTFRGSSDRIAPTRSVSVPVTLSNLPSGAAATIDVEGSGGANGTATVTSGASLAGSGTVTVRGDAQTTPGNAGNLRLRATVAGRVAGRSRGFTVAAWPADFVTSRIRDIDSGGAVGVVAQNAWSSDGSTGAELDEVERTERVDIGSRDNPPFTSGAGTSTTSGTSSFLPGTASPTSDRHSYGRASINTGAVSTGTYTLVYRQNFLFNDRRTGVTGRVVQNSGFTITHTVAVVQAPMGIRAAAHRTVKAGAAVTVEGRATTAGSGTASSDVHTL